MVVRISKNRKLNVAYVQFRRGRVKTTVEFRPGVLVDLDKKGGILGIEVLSLSSVAPALSILRPRFAATSRKG